MKCGGLVPQRWWAGPDLNRGPPPRKGYNRTSCYLGPVEEVIHEFELICRAQHDNAPKTIKDQGRALSKLLRILGAPGIFTKEDIMNGLASMSKADRVHATKAIRKLLKAIGREDMVKGLKIPSYGARKWHLPSDEELRLFYEALDREDAKLAFRLLAETGLRKNEILKARVGDIDWDHMAIIPNRATATKRSGIGFFTPETAELLREAVKGKDPDDLIFPYRSDIWLRKAFKRAERATGVKVCPQMLRVRFADKMGEVDIPDRYVDILQGRAPTSVLARHYTPSGLKKLRSKWSKASLKVT